MVRVPGSPVPAHAARHRDTSPFPREVSHPAGHFLFFCTAASASAHLGDLAHMH
jgi:hypothetical protein